MRPQGVDSQSHTNEEEATGEEGSRGGNGDGENEEKSSAQGGNREEETGSEDHLEPKEVDGFTLVKSPSRSRMRVESP